MTESRPSSVLRGLATAAALILSGLIATYGVTLGVLELLMFLRAPTQDPAISTALSAVLQAIGFLLAVGIYMRVTSQCGLLSLQKPDATDVKWGLGVAAVLVLIERTSAAVFEQMDIDTATSVVVDIGSEHPEVFLYLIPLAFLAIGPGEELLFRGAIQGRLKQSLSTPVAILTASALFALMHVVSLMGTGASISTYLVVVFVLGTILGYAYEKTENLLVPILAHGAYDATLFVIMYLHLSGVL